MSLLEKKSSQKRSADHGDDHRRFRTAFPILILMSLALLILSRLEHKVVDQVRWRVTEVMIPVLDTLMVPVEPMRWAKRQAKDFFTMGETLTTLREENAKLRQWKWRAEELQHKLDKLTGLVRAVEEPGYEFVTARVLANSSGAFVRSALINAGRQQKVRPGFPVVNAEGLVGRIVDTGKSSARVLLLTDLNSRVPVRVGPKGTRAILIGDNGPHPRLDYVSANAKLVAGERVATSGAAGVFPPGLQVGEVVLDRKGFRVRPKAALDQLEYLSVLFYNSPRLEITDRPLPLKGAKLIGQKKFKAMDDGDQHR